MAAREARATALVVAMVVMVEVEALVEREAMAIPAAL
jgi:hypothetical protein